MDQKVEAEDGEAKQYGAFHQVTPRAGKRPLAVASRALAKALDGGKRAASLRGKDNSGERQMAANPTQNFITFDEFLTHWILRLQLSPASKFNRID